MKIIILALLVLLTQSELTSTTINILSEESNIPITLQSLLYSCGVTKVELNMKHLIKNTNIEHEGIIMHIHSQNELSSTMISQITSAFGVSEKK